MKEQYEVLKQLVASLEDDMVKFSEKEVNSAGTRVRKGLQAIRKQAQELRLLVTTVKNDRKSQNKPADGLPEATE